MEKTLYKYVGEIKKIDESNRTLTAIGSKEVMDREGDVIKISGIDTKAYKTNPVVQWAHEYHGSDLTGGLPIAKAEKVWKSGDELRFKLKFATAEENPKADLVFNLYKGGYLHAFSIGFIPDQSAVEYPREKEGNKNKKNVPWRIFNKSELLEISAVPVPANASAVLAGINKAWDDGVIDGSELAELEDLLKEEVVIEEGLSIDTNDSIDPMKAVASMLNLEQPLIEEKSIVQELVDKDNIIGELTEKSTELEQTVSELANKAIELEQKIKELELKEVDTEDDYLSELYDAYGLEDIKTDEEEFIEYLEEVFTEE